MVIFQLPCFHFSLSGELVLEGTYISQHKNNKFKKATGSSSISHNIHKCKAEHKLHPHNIHRTWNSYLPERPCYTASLILVSTSQLLYFLFSSLASSASCEPINYSRTTGHNFEWSLELKNVQYTETLVVLKYTP